MVNVYTVHPNGPTYNANREFRAIRDPVDEQAGSYLREGQQVRLFRNPNKVSSLDVLLEGQAGLEGQPVYLHVPDAYIIRPLMPFWQKAAVGIGLIGLLAVAGTAWYTLYADLL